MGFVHAFADGFVIALFERFANVEHALLLADHIAGALVILLGNLILNGVELLHRSSAQKLLSEHLGDALARRAAVVVGRPHQLVLHARVEQDEFVAFRIEREIGIFQRAAVQTDQVTLLAEHRSELVHDAAVHAAVVVFGGLADLRQLKFVDPAAVEIVQRKSVSRFERRRRRHAGAQRNVAREYRIEAADLAAALLNLAADAEDVTGPALGGFVRLVQSELRTFAEVQRIGAHLVRAVELDGRDDTLIDGAGENEAPVVIRVLADQVDTTRRSEEDSPGAVKLSELLTDFFFHWLLKFFKLINRLCIIRR